MLSRMSTKHSTRHGDDHSAFSIAVAQGPSDPAREDLGNWGPMLVLSLQGSLAGTLPACGVEGPGAGWLQGQG